MLPDKALHHASRLLSGQPVSKAGDMIKMKPKDGIHSKHDDSSNVSKVDESFRMAPIPEEFKPFDLLLEPLFQNVLLCQQVTWELQGYLAHKKQRPPRTLP